MTRHAFSASKSAAARHAATARAGWPHLAGTFTPSDWADEHSLLRGRPRSVGRGPRTGLAEAID